MGSENLDMVDGARALLAWWALAGVDEAVSESPRGWLRPMADARAPAASGTVAVATFAAPTAAAPAWPTDLAGFHQWLAEDDLLPEARWGGTRIMPAGAVAPRLMVVADLPDPADTDAGAPFAGEAGRLLDGMLRAIGESRASIYLASLAVARPAGGTIGPADAAALAARMRHHIALVGPKRVLILGETTSRALPTASGSGGTPAAAGGLRRLNHDGGTLDAVATFHPRFLLRQPAAKAQAWAALRTLIEDMDKS